VVGFCEAQDRGVHALQLEKACCFHRIQEVRQIRRQSGVHRACRDHDCSQVKAPVLARWTVARIKYRTRAGLIFVADIEEQDGAIAFVISNRPAACQTLSNSDGKCLNNFIK